MRKNTKAAGRVGGVRDGAVAASVKRVVEAVGASAESSRNGERRYREALTILRGLEPRPIRYYNRLNTQWERRRDGMRLKVAWWAPVKPANRWMLARVLRLADDASGAAGMLGGTNFFFYFTPAAKSGRRSAR